MQAYRFYLRILTVSFGELLKNHFKSNFYTKCFSQAVPRRDSTLACNPRILKEIVIQGLAAK